MGIRNRRSPEPELEVANRAAADPDMDDMVSSNSMEDESTMGKVKGQIDLVARKTGLQVRELCLKKIGPLYVLNTGSIITPINYFAL